MTSTSEPMKNEMKSDQSIFKCDEHGGIIFKQLQSFYAANELFDTVLITGVGDNRVSIQAHRIVLSALSGYFQEVFRDAETVLKKNVLEFKHIEAATLKAIIDFFYTGSIALSHESVQAILRAASFFKVNNLIDGCCEYLEKNISSDNSLALKRLAEELDLSRLKEKSLEYTINHLEKITELLKADEMELKELLFCNNINEQHEQSIFSSLLAWINFDITNREHLKLELLSMVRFQHLPPRFIVEHIHSVCKTIECFDLMTRWLRWHLLPETRSSEPLNCELSQEDSKSKLAFIQVSYSGEIFFQVKGISWLTKKRTCLWKDKKYFSTKVIDNKLFVIGGEVKNNITTPSIECLDLHTFQWSELPPMKRKRRFCQVENLNGDWCVFGGWDVRQFVNFIEIYNSSTREWYDVKPPSQPKLTSKIAAYNGVLYIIDFHSRSLQCYDVSFREWNSIRIQRDSLCNFGFVAVEGFVYVIGGEKDGVLQNVVKRYNLSTRRWCDVAPLSYPCSHIKTVLFDNKIVICTKTISNEVIFNEYNIDTDTWDIWRPFAMDGSYYSSSLCTLNQIL